MTQEAVLFSVILGIFILMLLVVAIIEAVGARRSYAADIRRAYEQGYEQGYEEAATRAYTFTKASKYYTDWQTFREDLDAD